MILELKTELAVREPASGERLLTPAAAAAFLEDLRDLAQEAFVVLTLNTKNRVIRRHLVSLGTVSSTLVGCREFYRPAISDGASSVIAAHNHPSGDASPSADDIRITRKLMEAGRIVDITLLDHLIIGNGPPFSLREAGLLNFNNFGENQHENDP
jgi:DNA repair protein RadC